MEAYSRSAALLGLAGALVFAGCKGETSSRSGPLETATAVPARSAPAVAPSAAAPRPTAQASGEAEGAVAAPKTIGRPGELLTGDVYSFKAISVQPCGGSAPKSVTPQASASAPSHAESAVIGALVEITANGRLSISPRDVQLASGGIIFYAKVDEKRSLPRCTPLLKRSMIQKDQVAKGYVLFDVPLPEPRNLELTYRPTRWGGASPVRVRVRG